MLTGFQTVASSSEGCCYLLSADRGGQLLLDAGVKVDDIRLATGFGLATLAGCLVSHAHGDHIAAVPKLAAAGVNCYGSAETWQAHGKSHHRYRTVCAGITFDVAGFRVLAFEAVHDQPGTLGFLIAHGDDRALYLTDSAYSPFRFDGLTHVFVECNHSAELMRARAYGGDLAAERYARTTRTHMSLERLMEMLKSNDLDKVREIHLLHLSDGNSDEVAFADAVRRQTGKPVYVAPKRERVAQ